MSIRRWVGFFAVGLGLMLVLPGSDSVGDVCPAIEATNNQGQHYRLDGVCVMTADDQVDALLDEDWKLSVWTGEQYVPIVAVIDEYRWLGPSRVELNFLTLNDDVSMNITSGSVGNS